MTRRQRHRGEAGLTLVELLVAVVILALSAGAILGGLTTLSSGSGLNRSQANVGAVVRNAAEAIKSTSYVACDSTTPNPVFYSGGSFVAYGSALTGISLPADPV